VNARTARAEGLHEARLAGHGGQRAGQHQARRQPDQHEVGDGQRMRPLLDEAQAGIDHRGAVPQRDGAPQHQHGQQHRPRRGDPEPQREPPQRDQRDEGRQHDHLARHPRGAPHQHRAPGARLAAQVHERGREARDQQQLGQRQRAAEEGRRQPEAEQHRQRERGHQALRGTGQRGEEEDREGGMHARYSGVPCAGAAMLRRGR
jgi:hypothetical protein